MLFLTIFLQLSIDLQINIIQDWDTQQGLAKTFLSLPWQKHSQFYCLAY
jgi:hypothetical protein